MSLFNVKRSDVCPAKRAFFLDERVVALAAGAVTAWPKFEREPALMVCTNHAFIPSQCRRFGQQSLDELFLLVGCGLESCGLVRGMFQLHEEAVRMHCKAVAPQSVILHRVREHWQVCGILNGPSHGVVYGICLCALYIAYGRGLTHLSL